MIVLMLEAGENRYAIRLADVIEVAPRARLQSMVSTPSWVAGYFAYRGRVVPVIDLPLLVTQNPCPVRWNSRIVMLQTSAVHGREMVGVLAERVTTVHLPDDMKLSQQESGCHSPWGPILTDDHGMFQMIELSRFLPEERRLELFATEELEA